MFLFDGDRTVLTHYDKGEAGRVCLMAAPTLCDSHA